MAETPASGAKSLRAIGAALDAQGFPSRYGKSRSAVAMANVLKRIEAARPLERDYAASCGAKTFEVETYPDG